MSEEMDRIGGPVRWARLVRAAASDAMIWEIDYEILNGRKPTDDELAVARDAFFEQRMRPGVMWPGIDF